MDAIKVAAAVAIMNGIVMIGLAYIMGLIP